MLHMPLGMPEAHAMRWTKGRSFFADPWVEAGAATTLRDGLGPVFNARSCTACHPGGGRSSPPPLLAGEPPTAWQDTTGLTARLGHVGRPDPRYGEQLNTRSVRGLSLGAGHNSALGRGEGHLQVRYQRRAGRLPDGEPYVLWQPLYRVSAPADGPLHRASVLAPRLAPGLENVALIERVDEALIRSRIDPRDRDRDGISGRANALPQGASGRYGLKLSQATLAHQVASALSLDIGITSAMFPQEACAIMQKACRQARSGAGPAPAGGAQHEIDEALLADMVFFMRQLGLPTKAGTVPAQASTDATRRGLQAFNAAGCQSCHATAAGYLGLHSDLLLHDMGPGLADGRNEHLASGREWRTAPLRGLRWRGRLAQVESYLHDGRASTLQEAILWHDGEARRARQAYERMSARERQALRDYLASL